MDERGCFPRRKRCLMRFLINMHLPSELGGRLIAQGHACRHVGDWGVARASDAVIILEDAGTHSCTLPVAE